MTLVVKYHEGAAARQKRALRHYKKKALRLCSDLKERVGSGRGRPFTRRGIQDRMDGLQGVEEAIDWTFDEEGQAFSWRFNDDEWERLLEEAGKSLLFTTHEDWSAKNIIKAYEGKWKVEHSFRLLKGPIPVRPIYHGREDRIREHCFLMYLLIVIHRYLMEQLREPVLEKFGIGEETLHRLLRELRLVTSKPSDTNEPEFVVEDRGTIENAVIRSLDLERFIPGADRHEL